MMKKIFLMAVAILAMSLVACDGTSKQQSNAAEQPGVEQAAGESKAGAPQAVVPDGLTGDMEKDAEIIVKASLDQSMKMADGKDDGAEQQKLQKLMDEAKNYYGKQGKTEEFAKLVGEKMAKGITDVAAQMKKH